MGTGSPPPGILTLRLVCALKERVMIRHVAGIGEIVDDIDAGVRFYREVLGLTVQHEPGSGYAVVEVLGVLHFSVWARWAAVEATFGSREHA